MDFRKTETTQGLGKGDRKAPSVLILNAFILGIKGLHDDRFCDELWLVFWFLLSS